MYTKWIRIYSFHNLKSKTDLIGTLSKNLLGDKLVKPICKFAKSVTKTSSKVQELKIYNEAINNLIYENKWRKAVN